MPISSTANVLTRSIAKPAPKSLNDPDMIDLREAEYGEAKSVRLIRDEDQISLGSGSRRGTPINPNSPYGSPRLGGLNRERHMFGISGRMTAMVAPVGGAALGVTAVGSDSPGVRTRQLSNLKKGHGYKSTYYETYNSDTKTALTCGERMKRVGGAFLACITGCGRIWCYVHNIASLLIGMFLGSLITGLIVGLILWAEIKARDAVIADEPEFVDCFKDPCPSGQATCSYQGGNTSLVCNCVGNTTQNLGQAGLIGGYTCSFFNQTFVNTTALGP